MDKIMAQNFVINEMSSQDFHTLALEGWHEARPGAAEVTYEPWLCEFLLQQKYTNRPISPANLQRLKDDLIDQGFVLNGETLIYTANIENLDGQHRLTAAKETGQTFRSFSIWGVSDTVTGSLGAGKKRSGAEDLAIAGEANYSAMAAGLRVLYRLERQAMRTSGTELRNTQIKTYLLAHPGFKYSVSASEAAKAYVVKSLGSALHYSFTQRDKDLAHTFFQDLVKGENLTRRDPVLVLRDFLGARKEAGRQRGDMKTKADVAAQIIVAWNAVRTKKSISTPYLLSVDTRPFPEIV